MLKECIHYFTEGNDQYQNVNLYLSGLKAKFFYTLLLTRFSRVRLYCDPIDGSPPGSPVPGFLQARTLEWVAISFSRESSQPRDGTLVSYIDRQILYHQATREAIAITLHTSNAVYFYCSA